MRYFLDTEFNGFGGCLISLALVPEDGDQDYYVVVPMTDCKFLIEEESGPRRVDMAKGQVYRREAGVAHNVVNGGEAFMSFIEIELK